MASAKQSPRHVLVHRLVVLGLTAGLLMGMVGTVTPVAVLAAGGPDHLVLAPADATIVAGESRAYTAEGFDADGNSLGDVTGETTFTIDAGVPCPDATCAPAEPGDHTVTGTDGMAAGTATLHVDAAPTDPAPSDPAPTATPAPADPSPTAEPTASPDATPVATPDAKPTPTPVPGPGAGVQNGTTTLYVATPVTAIGGNTGCADPGYNTIADAVAEANAGGTVHICPGTYNLAETVVITVDNLTLEGADAATTIIDGANDGSPVQLFDAIGESITVTGLTLQNGLASNGGGAVRAGSITVADSSFVDNRNTSASAGGGAIFANTTATVTNSTFDGNLSQSFPGGAVGANATLRATDSTFLGNLAAMGGGALASFSAIFVHGSTFTANESTGDGSLGGAIAGADMVDISDSTFTTNSSVSGGGAVAAAGPMVVTGSTFSGNQSDDQAGAIYGEATIEVIGSTFSANHALAGGGAIAAWNDAITIANSTFSANTASDNGGAIIAGANTVTLTNSTFLANTADGQGDTIRAADVAMANTIIANDAEVPDDCVVNNVITDGGGNFSTDAICASHVTLADLDLGPLADNGGSTWTIALGADSVAIDAGVDAVCNVAPVDGVDQRGTTRPQGTHCDSGAFEVVGPRTLFVALSPAVIGDGGGTCDAPDYNTIAGAVADANAGDTVFLCMGTYYQTAPVTVTVDNLTIQGEETSTATIVDGANGGDPVQLFDATGMQLTVIDVGLRNGAAPDGDAEPGGGAIRARVVTVARGYFVGNRGTDGGAIRADETATITDTWFIDNHATRDGGAVWTGTAATINVSGASGATNNFSDNDAGRDGGAVWAGTGATVDGGTAFVLNTAAGHAGAVYSAGPITILRTLFSANTAAGGSGGAIFGADSIDVRQGTFEANTAQDGTGGAISDSSGNVSITNSTLYDNSAATDGGAVYAGIGTNVLTVTNSTLLNNAAVVAGDAIRAGNLTTANSIFKSTADGTDNCAADAVTDNGGTFSSDATCATDIGTSYPNTALADLAFGDLYDMSDDWPVSHVGKTFPLGQGNHAINAGIDAICNASPVGGVDQRGVTRPQAGRCDSGAYEVDLDHLVLSPADTTIASGGSQAYTAEGFGFGDVSLGDVTDQTTFTIDGSGSCTGDTCGASDPGEYTVTGTIGTATGTTTLYVGEPQSVTIYAPDTTFVGQAGQSVHYWTSAHQDAWFSSADDAICTVDEWEGDLVLLAVGTCTITVHLDGGNGYAPAQDSAGFPVIAVPETRGCRSYTGQSYVGSVLLNPDGTPIGCGLTPETGSPADLIPSIVDTSDPENPVTIPWTDTFNAQFGGAGSPSTPYTPRLGWACDDCWIGAEGVDSVPGLPIGFTVNFYGTEYDTVYVNSNGSIAFGSGSDTYDEPLNTILDGAAGVVAYGLDLDNREIMDPLSAWGSGRHGDFFYWGRTTVGGRQAFVATWMNSQTFSATIDATNWNTFQIVLVDRSDVASNDVDIIVNYGSLQANDQGYSDGCADGNDTCVAIGVGSVIDGQIKYASIVDDSSVLYNGRLNADVADDGAHPLNQAHLNSDVPGRFIFQMRDGELPQTATPPGPPAITGIEPGNASGTVSWSDPADTGGSPILGYVLRWRLSGSADDWATQDCDASGCSIADLTNGVEYEVEVAAVNGTGQGDWSAPDTFMPLDPSLAYIILSPDEAAIAAGGSQTYTAEGFDADNNDLGDVTPGTTFTIDLGSCTGASCTSTDLGDQTVTGTYVGNFSDTATLHVVPVHTLWVALTPEVIGDGGGTCEAPDYNTIAGAVDAANSGDTVHICAGDYNLAETVTITKDNLTLQGAGAGAAVIDGANDGSPVQLFNATGQRLTVSGLTLRNGSAITGGAIRASTIHVADCAFTGNGATGTGGIEGAGGAIFADADVTVTGSSFTGNTAEYIGAGIASLNGSATIGESTFTNNGLIAVVALEVIVSGSTFTGNQGSSFGAAVFAGNATVTDSTFTGNAAPMGPALLVFGDATVTGSTFAGNTAAQAAGAIAAGFFGGGSLVIANSTFTGNVVEDGPAGAVLGADVVVTSSTFAGNTSPAAGAAVLATTSGFLTNSILAQDGGSDN
ncbi:MAG: choice-of-anchor Q domain-containing protein, partial [Chloroflexota bacterium]